MKSLPKATDATAQEQIKAFTDELASFANPHEVWSMIQEKINTFKASDKENKFVTLSAVMNFVSALIQMGFGLMLKSMSVISSAIDSLLDFVLGVFNLFLLNESKKKQDTHYNFGYGKLQWFGALSQWWVMMFFGVVLWYFSVMKLTDSSPVDGVWLLLIIMILDFIGWVACVMYYHLVIKTTQNMIVLWTLKKLYAWLVFNVWIMSWLFLIRVWERYFDAWWYFIDAIVWVIVAWYICFNGWGLLYDGYGMLMDKSLPPDEIAIIKGLINWYKGDVFRRDNLRTRMSWTKKYIDFTLYIDAKKKSFTEIYEICVYLKKHLENDIQDSIVTIVPKPHAK
jgi:ferrous-iron efflux pump FieF